VRLIEIVADCGNTDTLRSIAEHHGAVDVWCVPCEDEARHATRMLVHDDARQAVLDALQQQLGAADDARIVVTPVDATLPRPEPKADERERRERRAATTREELYTGIERGAALDRTFVLMVALSTVVAAIGLVEDNVAVVVGAMVIAPLLGPIIALAFAVALGDAELLLRATRTGSAGLALAFVLSLGIGAILPLEHLSAELTARTDVGLAGVALALASGAAAVLSLSSGVSSALVGVMVAVALLPPAATCGMLLGSGRTALAGGAALLLAVNVVCVILAGLAAFRISGVRPRTWLEQRHAQQSVRLHGALWAFLLLLLVAVILLRETLPY
jgi:uncharacterized hydrophobic protein (TIGR00341 family)